MSKFTQETTIDDLSNFAASLSPNQLKYKDVLQIYGEHYSHTVYSNRFIMKFNKRYFQKKNKKGSSQSFANVGIKLAAKTWTDEEIEALQDGVEEYGVGNWEEIYKANEELFSQHSKTPTKLRIKYMKDLKNKE